MLGNNAQLILKGPPSEALRSTGLGLIALSLVLNSALGSIGLLAILAVESQSQELLKLFMGLGSLALGTQLIRSLFLTEGFWLSIFGILLCVVQGAALWWAFKWNQELEGGESVYLPPSASPRQPPLSAGGDPFEAYTRPNAQPPPLQHHDGQEPKPGQSSAAEHVPHTGSKADSLL